MGKEKKRISGGEVRNAKFCSLQHMPCCATPVIHLCSLCHLKARNLLTWYKATAASVIRIQYANLECRCTPIRATALVRA